MTRIFVREITRDWYNRPRVWVETKEGYKMDFLKVLRAANLSRVARFGHGDLNSHLSWNEMQWGCAIGGECGELLNLLKKYNRQAGGDPSQSVLVPMIGDEIADVIIYLDLLAAKLGLDLEGLIRWKFNQVSQRQGYPERIE